jgi:glutaredoxin
VSTARLTLIGKPGCHLCDTARDVVTEVLAEPALAASVTLEELSLLDDPELAERFADEIPVVLINGEVHNIWRIDAMRLSQALVEATS